MTDSRTGFGGLGCGPSQLTEGEPGCIFLPQRVTNPVESPLDTIQVFIDLVWPCSLSCIPISMAPLGISLPCVVAKDPTFQYNTVRFL